MDEMVKKKLIINDPMHMITGNKVKINNLDSTGISVLGNLDNHPLKTYINLNGQPESQFYKMMIFAFRAARLNDNNLFATFTITRSSVPSPKSPHSVRVLLKISMAIVSRASEDRSMNLMKPISAFVPVIPSNLMYRRQVNRPFTFSDSHLPFLGFK